MNEYNHHRIIERFVLDRHLDASVKKTFLDASDFTDSIWAKSDYFFYRNYYSIKTENDTIRINRVDNNGYISNNSISTMRTSGEKEPNNTFFIVKKAPYSLNGWNETIDEKEFFSSVNNRKKSSHFDELDTGNQSDNVAFLHAMGAEGETAGDTGEPSKGEGKTSRSIFEDHLKKCFAEYLFLEDEKEALFMLGIAFHGIMDSFTPSHMGFQKYTEQDMGLHAQGDVIPVMGNFNDEGELSLFDDKGKLVVNFIEKEDDVVFDPGQYTKEKSPFTKEFIKKYKYYDGNDNLNLIEKKMFRVFLYISDLQTKDDTGSWKSLNVENYLRTFSNNKKEINEILGKEKEINVILGKKEKKYRYGPKSYAYSEAALKVMREIYNLLSRNRKAINSYGDYKQRKNIVEKAVDIWKKVYDGDVTIDYIVNNSEFVREISMKEIRKEHDRLSLYFEDSQMREYKDGLAQQNIERLNRLKG